MSQLIYSKVLLIVAALTALLISTVPGKASALTFANNGHLSGPGSGWWLPFSSGGLHISANTFTGSNSQGLTGDFTAATYNVNQYSQIAITGTQLRNLQWIGPSVRIQNGGGQFLRRNLCF